MTRLTSSMLTADARAAMVSRRNFLKGTGAFFVAFSGGLNVAALAQRLDGAGSSQLDSWIAIASDGSVTAYTGKCELGHGLFTAQTQLVAE